MSVLQIYIFKPHSIWKNNRLCSCRLQNVDTTQTPTSHVFYHLLCTIMIRKAVSINQTPFKNHWLMQLHHFDTTQTRPYISANLSLSVQDHDKESNQYKPNSTQESLTYAALNHVDTAQTPISILFYSILTVQCYLNLI